MNSRRKVRCLLAPLACNRSFRGLTPFLSQAQVALLVLFMFFMFAATPTMNWIYYVSIAPRPAR
jgi:hypothetical protein